MKLILIEEKYIRDWEFSIRLGITRDELRKVIADWPNLKDDDDTDRKDNPELIRILAINNSLNEILHVVDITEEDWAKWINKPKEEVKKIYHTWAAYKGWRRTGLM